MEENKIHQYDTPTQGISRFIEDDCYLYRINYTAHCQNCGPCTGSYFDSYSSLYCKKHVPILKVCCDKCHNFFTLVYKSVVCYDANNEPCIICGQKQDVQYKISLEVLEQIYQKYT